MTRQLPGSCFLLQFFQQSVMDEPFSDNHDVEISVAYFPYLARLQVLDRAFLNTAHLLETTELPVV